MCWRTAPVQALRYEQGRVAVLHANGTEWCDTLYCALCVAVHSPMARRLGAALDATGYAEVDAHHATNVPGLYGAGDVCKGLSQIAVALGHRSLSDASGAPAEPAEPAAQSLNSHGEARHVPGPLPACALRADGHEQSLDFKRAR